MKAPPTRGTSRDALKTTCITFYAVAEKMVTKYVSMKALSCWWVFRVGSPPERNTP